MLNWLLSLIQPDLDALLRSLSSVVAKLEAYAARKATEIQTHKDEIAAAETQVRVKTALVDRATRVGGKPYRLASVI